jgi:hypothetical protein
MNEARESGDRGKAVRLGSHFAEHGSATVGENEGASEPTGDGAGRRDAGIGLGTFLPFDRFRSTGSSDMDSRGQERREMDGENNDKVSVAGKQDARTLDRGKRSEIWRPRRDAEGDVRMGRGAGSGRRK